MKRLLWILFVFIAFIGASSLDTKAFATLNISGTVVQDSITGLEWLVMSQTVNKSPDRINAGDYSLKAAGWRLATIGEIQTLLMNAGFTEPFNGSQNFDSANYLMALFGNTGVYDGEYGHQLSIFAFSGSQGSSAGNLYCPTIFVGLGPWGIIGDADFPGSSNPSSLASPTIGNWLVRSNPGIASPIFGPNSAKLTNRYLPLPLGDKITYRTYGLPEAIYAYVDAFKYEVIDQVTCLKIKYYASVYTDIVYYWLAQDTWGNVWVLQYQNVESGDLRYYGKNYAKIFMPNPVSIGSVLWNPDGMETVSASGITVPTLSTGLGPFYNCIKSKTVYPDGDIDYQYFAPGVGEVKEEWNDDGGINGVEISVIKERPRTMPWLPLLLGD